MDEPHDSHRARNAPSPLESTITLLDRARRGDAGAIERLFARHLRPLQRWATGRLPRWARTLADTDDLVQDTLLQTFKRVEHLQTQRPGDLNAYLRQAVMNRIRDELRRKARRPEAVDVDLADVPGDTSPLEDAIGQQALETYERALDRLRPEDRELLIARIEMGYSYEELADISAKPTADAARKAAQRALVRLAEEMKRGRA